MCGIVGYLSHSTIATEETVRKMATRIEHRGPDADGVWADQDAGIALGHRRLSIIDLSDAGKQPMLSIDGRLVLVFNGEIYNHIALRGDIEAAGWSTGWRGHSDTETLLAALQIWGVAETLPRLNGMFAFALWDRSRRLLTLARDRIGEKPLFYGKMGGSFLFGSELKALTVHPDWQSQINRDVLATYLRHGYVPDPHCIYQGMSKLPPAHWVEISNGKPSAPCPYWDLETVAIQPRRTDPSGELVNEVEALLGDAVKLRMDADVPIGAFLSGGIDSSVIVALMCERASQPVKTFTIGFDVSNFNEAEHAKAIANHLGTDHTELYVSPQDALDLVPQLPQIWDEPFADSSQIPTFLLSQMTKEHVTVSLSGDGGDELFCGYERYKRAHKLNNQVSKLQGALGQTLIKGMKSAPTQVINSLMNLAPQRIRFPAFGDRLNKLGDILTDSDEGRLYRRFISQFQNPQMLVPNSAEVNSLLAHPKEWPSIDNFHETMMYLDTLTYLPGDILTKVDRASMAVGLEARVPMLDHRVIELAWSLPFDMKQRDGQMKWVLRQILGRHVPRELFERPKMGFGVPIEHWLTGPLREWAEVLLSEEALEQDGLFNASEIRKIWREHCSGSRRWHYQIWTVLMFQAWWQNQKNSLKTC